MDESSAQPTDPHLLRRAAHGEESACRALVNAHGPQVYALCRRLADEPEDAYQTAWEKVFGALRGFSPDGAASLRTWILTVARRTLVDAHRRARVRGPVLELVDVAHDHDPSRELERHEADARLWSAIATLPAEQRHAVVGHHVHGLSLEELAREVGVAIGTIKSRLHRGRAQLARHLREQP